VPDANPFAPDNSDAALQPPAGPPAGGSITDTLRKYLHGKIDEAVNSPAAGFDAEGNMPAMAAPVFNAQKTIASYVPGPASDALISGLDTISTRKTLADSLHAAVDTAFDPAARARAINSVGRGVQQGFSGFNQGLGNIIFAPSDALNSATDYVAGKIGNAIGAPPAPTLPSAHDYYNRTFVAPAGEPQTPIEKRIRGTAQSVGSDAPAFLLGGGLASAGVRSGVTAAERAAPGLLETIRAPATKAADYITDGKVSVGNAAGFIASKLRDLVPNLINGLHPTNIANAMRATNLQAATDTALQRVAAHPYVAAYGDVARDWRNEKRREAQESSQQAPPSN
jgi:hypothetical protein